MLAFSNDYYGFIFRVTQSVELFCTYVAQVILRWLMQRNIVALAKSTHIERMRENFEIFDFQLSEHDMKIISELDTNTSLFFNHQTPEAVDMFVNMITERKGKI